jgi:hypothetical protein
MKVFVFSNLDKRKAIRRELGLRRFKYPQWVDSGRMKQHEADLQIAVFEAIERDYKEKAEADRAAGDLFGTS